MDASVSSLSQLSPAPPSIVDRLTGIIATHSRAVLAVLVVLVILVISLVAVQRGWWGSAKTKTKSLGKAAATSSAAPAASPTSDTDAMIAAINAAAV